MLPIMEVSVKSVEVTVSGSQVGDRYKKSPEVHPQERGLSHCQIKLLRLLFRRYGRPKRQGLSRGADLSVIVNRCLQGSLPFAQAVTRRRPATKIANPRAVAPNCSQRCSRRYCSVLDSIQLSRQPLIFSFESLNTGLLIFRCVGDKSP